METKQRMPSLNPTLVKFLFAGWFTDVLTTEILFIILGLGGPDSVINLSEVKRKRLKSVSYAYQINDLMS